MNGDNMRRHLPRKRRAGRVFTPINVAFHLAVALSIYSLHVSGLVADRIAYGLLTLVLLSLVFLEIRGAQRRNPNLWLVEPVVLASILTFALSYGFSNFLFLLPQQEQFVMSRDIGFHTPMVQAQYYSVLALGFMWLGYRMDISVSLGLALLRSFPMPRFSPVSMLVILGLLAISVLARGQQVSLGIFGYATTEDALTSSANVSQYLAILAKLGLLALAISTLQANRTGATRRDRYLAGVILVIEISFGLLSGFKAAVVLPVLVVLMCRYLAGRGVSRSMVLSFLGLLIIAYMVIEPFRARYNDSGRLGLNNYADIASMLAVQESTPTGHDLEGGSLFQELALRSNLSNIGAYGIVYADDASRDSSGDPNFLENLLLAPAYAFVPRAIWESKPLANVGHWYTTRVLGRQIQSSTAMGPVTWLYMAGGVTAVLLGFFVIGLVQRMVFVWFARGEGFGGAVVYFGVAGNFAFLPSAIDTLFVTLLRDVPAMLVLSHLLFRSSRRRAFQS